MLLSVFRTPRAFQKLKLTLSPEATANMVVLLDVMPHKVNNKTTDILVRIEHSDMFLKLKEASRPYSCGCLQRILQLLDLNI